MCLVSMVGNLETEQLDVEMLYKNHHRDAYALARANLKDRDEALDAVHDAFVKVMRSAERLEGRPMSYPWLYRIVVNVCIDRHRKKRRSCEQALDEETERRSAGPRSSAFEPSTAFETKELRSAIEAGFEGLSEQHRTVFMLRELHGMTYEEIAAELQCPVGTVMSRLFHARRKLRGALAEPTPRSTGLAA